MAAPIQIPSGIPAGVAFLIQSNMLGRELVDGLRPFSYYRMEADRKELPPGIGQTITHSKLGMFDVTLQPMTDPLADPSYATFSTEQYTAKPIPYSNGFSYDAPTAYVQIGDYFQQGAGKLGDWAGRTAQRLARGKLFAYAGGNSITRRAGLTGDTTLLVNSLAGLRHTVVNGSLVPVSSTNKLAVTITKPDASTITGKSITGVAPLNDLFPDGPGVITLDATLGGAVAAQSIVTAATAPKIIRAGGRTSTETIVANDKPTVQNLLAMRAALRAAGVPPHADGTYHLHVDETFMMLISADTQWVTATQGMGISPSFGGDVKVMPAIGITVFEGNDSPAIGRGKEVSVGATSGTGYNVGGDLGGGAGAAGSSVSMQDLGLDVVNSAGVGIRRALMTGRDCLIETYVDQKKYYSQMGIRPLGQVNADMTVYEMGSGAKFVAGEFDGWNMTIQPAVDPRMLQMKLTVSNVLDYTLSTDLTAATGGVSVGTRALRRAVVLEYGNSETLSGLAKNPTNSSTP